MQNFQRSSRSDDRPRLTPEQKRVARAKAGELILQWITLARTAGSHSNITSVFDAGEVAQFVAQLRLAPYVRSYLRVGYALDFQDELAPITAEDICDVFCDEERYRRAEAGKLRGAREVAMLIVAGHVRPGVEVSIMTSWRKSTARRMCESLGEEARRALLVGEFTPPRADREGVSGLLTGSGSIFARLIGADAKRDESGETDVQRFWRWAFSEDRPDRPFSEAEAAAPAEKPKTGLTALLAKFTGGQQPSVATLPAAATALADPSVTRVTDEEEDDDYDEGVAPASIVLGAVPTPLSVAAIPPSRLSLAATASGAAAASAASTETASAPEADAKTLITSLLTKGGPIAEALVEGVGNGSISVASATETAKRLRLIE